jgi:diguanylate cyclase (GGDEF)-like protein/PAS domain S-box-containing protein
MIAIVLTFALVSAASSAVSIWMTGRSKNRATVIQIASRQRMLAERYIGDVLLVESGRAADPIGTGKVLSQSARALLDGGPVPAVNGDDDATSLSAESDPLVRGQLQQEIRLVSDLTRAGSAYLAGRSIAHLPETGSEHVQTNDPVQHLRVLAALTSNISLNAARTIAAGADKDINDLILLQVGLGIGGLLLSLLLAWALVAATRRQTAHFRSLVTSSTDLVLVFGHGGCRYVSQSVISLLGRAQSDLLGAGFARYVHEDDREAVEAAARDGRPPELVFRVLTVVGEWRDLEAHLTDLSSDRHVRGIVLNARDITERVRLEQELTRQAQRDNFGTQLVEALEMADEEDAAYDVVELAMVEVEASSPMELLLSDSSRAQLERAAASPTAGPPGCPVQSPFSCVAVRRGNPVVFETSRALNACPHLRGRPSGACAAACVPVTFMGRALGVLHATSPDGKSLSPEQVGQLTTLATQAGARIGTVRAFQKTQLQAATDGLTGLINRRTLEARVRELMAAHTPFALVLADLDRFKQLNDTHGHEAGDRALRLFSQVVHSIVRSEDIVARIGGEEFVIVLPGLDETQAVTVLERLRTALGKSHTGDHPAFTASFGVSDSSHGSTLEEILRVADQGLYVSKQTGRDRVTIGKIEPGVTNGHLANGNGNGDGAVLQPEIASGGRPALHSASDEIEPRPSGVEIR